jgi:hypothetical protein
VIYTSQDLSTYKGQQNREKPEHISMPRAGFQPTIPVFERSNTIRALVSAATGIGYFCNYSCFRINILINVLNMEKNSFIFQNAEGASTMEFCSTLHCYEVRMCGDYKHESSMPMPVRNHGAQSNKSTSLCCICIYLLQKRT